MSRVLVVDDEPISLTFVSTVLARAGYTVDTASDPQSALDIAVRERQAVLVTDLVMPGMDGIELFRAVRERQPFTRGVLISAHLDFTTALRLVELGFDDCLLKPFTAPDLLAAVAAASAQFTRWVQRIQTFQQHTEERPATRG